MPFRLVTRRVSLPELPENGVKLQKEQPEGVGSQERIEDPQAEIERLVTFLVEFKGGS